MQAGSYMKILVALPARNEAHNIGRVLQQVRALYPDFTVLVVNDASRDNTSEVVRNHPGVMLIELPFWMGYGGALQAAYKYAYRNQFDAVIQLDADGQHDPASIQVLLKNIDKADVVVGSRFLRENEYNMPAVRRIGCHFLSLIGQRLTGMKITDPTSGYQALNRKALGIAIQDYYPMDYPDLDVLILMHRFRLKVIEVPVSMHESTDKTGMHDGLQVWYYAFKMILSIFVMMLRRP
jgi:glycosyltransferase involved in cell wall biosynthesis